MMTITTALPARFAALPGTASVSQRRRSGLAGFLLAPFRDVDDRPARKAAAVQAERTARLALMSGVHGERR